MVRKRLLLAPLAVVAGVLMGNSTVAAMQLRTAAPGDPTSASDRAFERGMAWARTHDLVRPDDCPAPDDDFLRGCVTGGGNG